MLARIAISVGALALCAVLPALAAERTPGPNIPIGPPNSTVQITVPVHLTQIPSGFTKFSIDCSFRYVGKQKTIGTESNRVDLPLVNGNYDGNVQMTIKLDSSMPSEIDGYKCDLWLYGKGEGVQPNPNATNPQARPKPGTVFAAHVEASF